MHGLTKQVLGFWGDAFGSWCYLGLAGTAWRPNIGHLHACADRPALRQQYINMYNNNTFDIMVMPTTPVTAPPIYSVEPYMLFNGKYVSNRVALRRTAIIEATVGAPGLSIPMGLADNGMPVGIQIQSRPGKATLELEQTAQA